MRPRRDWREAVALDREAEDSDTRAGCGHGKSAGLWSCALSYPAMKPSALVAMERVVDDRLLLGGQHLVERLRRRFDLLQALELRLHHRLAVVQPVDDRLFVAIVGGGR